METKRQSQVAELLKRNFSQVLQFEAPNICGRSVLITVTNVKVSPDLTLARFYLSIFGTEHKQEPLMMLQEELTTLRTKLAQRVRLQLRIVPNISLYLDDTVDEMFRIDDMMNKLEEEGQFGSDEVHAQ